MAGLLKLRKGSFFITYKINYYSWRLSDPCQDHTYFFSCFSIVWHNDLLNSRKGE